MEPISTTVIISTIVGYLAKKLKDNKTFQDFTTDFTSATINTIRPFFIEDEKPKELLTDLTNEPEEKIYIDAVANALAKAHKKDPNILQHLQEMYDTIKAKEKQGESISIVNSKNVVIGNITAGRDVVFGDNNQTGK